MKIFFCISILPIAVAVLFMSLFDSRAQAALFWQAGVQSKRPSLCFVGDAITSQPARVQQIKNYIQWFEEAANIRFQIQNTCPQQTDPDGKDWFPTDIRLVIPGTSWNGIANVYDQQSPIPGNGCGIYETSGGSWSRSPKDLPSQRSCLFNLRIGNDNFNQTNLGDPGGGSTPFLNHTLHEFGHALGLAHEHERFDVPQTWVEKYLRQISGVSAQNATDLYNTGYRPVSWVAAAKVSDLKNVPGYGTDASATGLKNAAMAINATCVQFGGGGNSYMSPYDRLSVMHYTWADMYSFAPGNYSNGGLSEADRLALHILYPEDNLVAEAFGTRVVRTGQNLSMWLSWAARGGLVEKVIPSITWKFAGNVYKTYSLNLPMNRAGNYPLTLTYTDFMGTTYSYDAQILVLNDREFNQRAGALLAAEVPAL